MGGGGRAAWTAALSLVLFCAAPFQLFSHSLTLLGGVNTFKFVDDPAAISLTDSEYAIEGSADIRGHVAENITYFFGGGIDTIWRYYLNGEAVFRFDQFKLGVGTHFQYSQEGKEFLYPAVSALIGIEVPGAIYTEVKTVLMLYENLAKVGNIGYNYVEFGIGYWTLDLVAGFGFDYKEYAENRENNYIIRDIRKRYFLHTEIHDKNKPWTVTLDAGWQTFQRTVTDIAAASDNDETAKVLFFDADFSIRLSRWLSWHIKGGIPLALFYPHSEFFWLNAQTGISLTIVD
jgi:hypothetical protein